MKKMENKMENNKCIILKRKEYDDLVAKAEGKKPDVINIYFGYGFNNNRIISSIDLSEKIYSQINRIIDLVLDVIRKNTEQNNSFIENQTRIETYKELANMSWIKRRKILKKYRRS